MILALDERNTCILAWAATVLVPGLVIVALVWPLIQRNAELDGEIASRQQQIVHYRRLLGSLPRLRAELEQERSNEDFKAFYYDADTPALAGAQLQSELQDMSRAADARLINTQFLPSGADEQPPRVRIRTQLRGDTEDLLDVVYAIEQARPFLFIDQMSVRSTARRSIRRSSRVRGRRTPVRNRSEGELTIRLDVFGYALGGGN
jgi:general secretion pathway protein M